MRSAALNVLCPFLALVMLLAACGSSGDQVEAASDDEETAVDLATGDDSPEPDSDSDSDDDSSSSAAGAGTSSASAADGEKTTLDDYLGGAARLVRGGGGGIGAGGLDTERLAEEQQLIQLEIQRCMQLEGFDYTPEEVGEGLRLFASADAQGLSAAEYAETEGFGIATRFDAVFEGEIDLTADEASDNDLHLETLSEGEADAWQFALRGAPPERNEQGQLIDPETGEVIQGGGRGAATGGCQADAQVSVRGDFSVLSELEDEFDLLEERIDADPRITEIRAAWTSCMRDLGFAYETVDEARDDFQQQFRPLLVSFFTGTGLGGQAGQGARGAALQSLADQGLTADQEADLQALQDLEIAAAVASLECAGDTDAEIEEITARYEAEFVETNRSTLEQISG